MCKFPENSVLYQTRQISDYYKCYVLQLNEKTLDDIMDNFLSVPPKWLDLLFRGIGGQNALELLLKRENEIVLGSNLKHSELRISILQDHEHKDLFHFTIVINFNTTWGRCFYWPFRILSGLNFKTILKSLHHSAQNE